MFVGDDNINWDHHWTVEQKDAKDFDDDPRKAFDYFIDLLPSPPFKVLDLGCGIGKWNLLWRKLGAIYEGLDASPSAIEIARKRHPDLKFYLMRAEEMDFEEEYDVIFCNTVLQHVKHENKKKLLPKVWKALKSNGLFIFQEKCDVNTETTFTRENWIKFVEQFGFKFLRMTEEGDPRNGFVFRKI
jgi:2-polyprenyl-3-methyl-5-hydroxy-6-metoxy-1,4-benzoquinol methylase